MAIKEVQVIQQIIICDMCKNEERAALYSDYFGKYLCVKCLEPLIYLKVKNCNHRHYITLEYNSLILNCYYCAYIKDASEEWVTDNEVIINELLKCTTPASVRLHGWERKEI